MNPNLGFDHQGQSHRGPIAAVGTLNDLVLSGSYDGNLGLWKISQEKLVLEGLVYLHSKGINCIAISPNQRWIATGGSDGYACLTEVESTNSGAIRCNHPGDVECVVFSADSRVLLTGGTDGYARLFDTTTGRQLCAIWHSKTVGAACRSTDNALLITGCNDHRLRLIDIRSGHIIKEIESHEGPVKAVAQTQKGIISTAHDRRLCIHDHNLNFIEELCNFTTTPKTLAVEPDGINFWVGCYDGYISRWVASKNSYFHRERSIHCPRAWPHGLSAFGFGRLVAGSFDGSPALMSFHEDDEIEFLQADAPVPCVSALSLGLDDTFLFGGDSGRVFCAHTSELDRQILPGDAGKIVAEVKGAITSLTGSIKDFVVGTWDGEVTRWIDRKLKWKSSWAGQSGLTVDRSGSPILRVSRINGRVLVGLYTGGWACFDENTGNQLWGNKQATGAVKCVDLFNDTFAVTGRYDPLRVGNARTGEIKAMLVLDTPVSDVVAFSPFSPEDRPRLAVCAGVNEVWIADLIINEDSWQFHVISRSGEHHLPVKALAWIDANTVLAGDYDGRILAHCVNQSPRDIVNIDCRTGVSALAVSPSGSLIWSVFDGFVGSHQLAFTGPGAI